MPLVQISIRAGRPPENIRSMIGEVTRVVAESLESPVEAIRVIVTEVPLSNWATGGITLQERADQQAAATGQPGR